MSNQLEELFFHFIEARSVELLKNPDGSPQSGAKIKAFVLGYLHGMIDTYYILIFSELREGQPTWRNSGQ